MRNKMLSKRICAAICITLFCSLSAEAETQKRPNILFCISDDQSYAHTSANGDPVIKTPGFDRIAREGLRFSLAFCDAPTCGPSRSAILTGQEIWRLEEAGNIHSTLPMKFPIYTDLLKQAGYAVGFTGKGWSPGRLAPGDQATRRERNTEKRRGNLPLVLLPTEITVRILTPFWSKSTKASLFVFGSAPLNRIVPSNPARARNPVKTRPR